MCVGIIAERGLVALEVAQRYQGVGDLGVEVSACGIVRVIKDIDLGCKKPRRCLTAPGGLLGNYEFSWYSVSIYYTTFPRGEER